MVEIFDCTLRDGGYINNWDFDSHTINKIYESCDATGIQYIEIGYIDKINLRLIDKKTSDILVMQDYNKREETPVFDVDDSIIDGIRVAVHKEEVYDCLDYINTLYDLGYITGIQLMGISNYSIDELKELSSTINNKLKFVSIADSNGALIPESTADIVNIFNKYNYLVSYHSHNNLQLSLINTIEAIKNGVDIVDCTLFGIGRGAGNLPTELLLLYLNKFLGYNYNISYILDAIKECILPLREKYNWGYNVPYAISGIEEIHPYYARDELDNDYVDMYNKLINIGKMRPIKYERKS